jgi:hypothetical protein
VSARSASRLAWSLVSVSLLLVVASVVLAFLNRSAPPVDDWGDGEPALRLSGARARVLARGRARLFAAARQLCGLDLPVHRPRPRTNHLHERVQRVRAPDPSRLAPRRGVRGVGGELDLAPNHGPARCLPRPPVPERPSAVAPLVVGGVAGRRRCCHEDSFRDVPLRPACRGPERHEPARSRSCRERARVVGADRLLILPLAVVATAFGMVLRFRQATGEERQQLKWFASAAALLAIAFPVSLIFPSGVLEDFVTLLFAGSQLR